MDFLIFASQNDNFGWKFIVFYIKVGQFWSFPSFHQPVAPPVRWMFHFHSPVSQRSSGFIEITFWLAGNNTKFKYNCDFVSADGAWAGQCQAEPMESRLNANS